MPPDCSASIRRFPKPHATRILMAKKSVRYRRRASQDVGSAVPPPSSAAPTDSDLQRELAELREKNRQLEATAARLADELSRLTEDFEKRLGVRGKSVSSQIGRAVLALLQSPAALLRLPGRPRRSPSLSGRKVKAFTREELAAAYESGGMDSLRALFDEQGANPSVRERGLLALAKQYQKDNQPAKAAALGRAAYDINPQPTLAKWLAFRLFDAGQIKEPLALLEGPADGCAFSASEARRLQEIKTLASFAFSLPEVPPKASPAYEPADGSLLYVAASCLPYHTSGYTTRTHELNLALQKAGKVTVVTRPGYPWDRPDRQGLPEGASTAVEGLEYLHIRTPSLTVPLNVYFREAAAGIAKVAAKKKVAAIHAASNHVNALPALLAARQLGLPFAYEMRGLWDMTRAAKIEGYEDSDRYRLGMQLEALVAREADRVFVISEALGEYIQKEWGVDPAKIELLPNCVNPETIERAKKMAGPKPDVFTVGYAGSLVEYEGLDLLIDALAELKQSGTIVHARIIGDGPARAKLEERTQKSALNAQVLFLGHLAPDEARTRLAETHIAVLPRRSNKVCQIVPPLKLVEAQALGLPLVVPDLEVFASEATEATVFSHDSVSSLAQGIFMRTKAGPCSPIAKTIQARPEIAEWSSLASSLINWLPHHSAGSEVKPDRHTPRVRLGIEALACLASRKSRVSLEDVEKTLAEIHEGPFSAQDLRFLHDKFRHSEPRFSALTGWLLWRISPNAELAATVRSQLIKLGEMKLPLRFLKEVDARAQTPPELALSRKLQNDINLWQRGFPLPPKAASPPYEVRPTVLYLLHNSLPYNSGGYATRTHGLLKAINERGQFSVIGVTRPGYPSDHKAHISKPLPAKIPVFDEIDDVRYERCEQSWRRSSATLAEYVDAFALRVEALARQHKCCLIHAASNFPNGLAAALASRRLGIPAIYEVRGLWELTRLSRDPLWQQSEHFAFTANMESQACEAADAVITLTGGLKDLLAQRGTSAEKISILPNAVNPGLFVPAERDRELAHSLGVKPDDVVIGYLGSIVAYEGLDDLLRALQLLRKQGRNNVKLLLVGDGSALPDLQALVSELGLQDITIVTGRVPHEAVAGYYSLVDIAAFPRKPLAVCETVSPIKPLEAMCMAKAIVVSSVKALAEMVGHERTGLVFQSGDVDDLARSLATLLDDDSKREDLGAAARTWATEQRSWATVCHTAEYLYARLGLSHESPAPATE